MELLEKRILSEGKIKPGNILKVDSFLNHQLDPELFYEMAQELKRLFADEKVTKVLTIEASGIAMAVMAGYAFGCKALFAKKSKSKKSKKGLLNRRPFGRWMSQSFRLIPG